MSLIKSIIIAFSMFSKIPMPQFEWREKEMRFMMCFFPWVGIILGAFEYAWFYIAKGIELGAFTYTCIGVAIPILITGGIHIDGFMDTMDALHSYQTRERKLEILKDPHIGAFSVISLMAYMLIYIGIFNQIHTVKQVILLGAGFYCSRILSSLCIVSLICAKKDGLVHTFSSGSSKKITQMVLCIQYVICMAITGMLSIRCMCFYLISGILFTIYYDKKCKKEFGGITGDTAGFYVVILECIFLVGVAFV